MGAERGDREERKGPAKNEKRPGVSYTKRGEKTRRRGKEKKAKIGHGVLGDSWPIKENERLVPRIKGVLGTGGIRQPRLLRPTSEAERVLAGGIGLAKKVQQVVTSYRTLAE